ncbi:hypothetical protein ElyMa_006068600 [Elysia marginata]|uniref:Uncharacterized protein n=1 Tax=Elysia marginata TaxID=1093978 RepID=A0AAV4GMZ7_9GAST|nr:hypothetical protein ElyMa_006068600 [Elysia marginata]
MLKDERKEKTNLITSLEDKITSLEDKVKRYALLAKENTSLKETVKNVEASKLYEVNYCLRQKNADLDENICTINAARDKLKEDNDKLEREIVKLKEQVKKEQSLKSKMKRELKEQKETLALVKEEEKLQLREDRHNKFTDGVRLA